MLAAYTYQQTYTGVHETEVDTYMKRVTISAVIELSSYQYCLLKPRANSQPVGVVIDIVSQTWAREYVSYLNLRAMFMLTKSVSMVVPVDRNAMISHGC